jgi:hypothetical protein
MPLHFNSIVEVSFQAVFESQGCSVGGFGWECHFKQSFVDELVVITGIFLSSVINIHFEGEEGKLKCPRYESECFRGILLSEVGCIWPATVCEGILYMLGLYIR